jgi:hypothetical protein
LRTFYPGLKFIYYTSVGSLKAKKEDSSCRLEAGNAKLEPGHVEVDCTGIELLEMGACGGLLYDEPIVEFIDSQRCEFKLGTKTVFASLGYGSAFHTGSPYHVLEPAVSYMLNHYRSEKAQLMQRLAETHFHPRTTCTDIASSDGTGFGPQDMMGVIYLQGGFCAAALAIFLVSMVMQGCSEKETTNAAGEPITAENLKESMQAVLRRKSFRMEQEEVSSVTKKEKQEEVSRSVSVHSV